MRLTAIGAFVALGAACNGDASHPAADSTPRSWKDGWEAANGDCNRQLPYGYSAVLLHRNALIESSYKTSYYDGYADAWRQGINLGYCDDLEYVGVARGSDFLSEP